MIKLGSIMSGILFQKTKIILRSKRMVKVVKFGGSSLASAEQFAKVGDIIRADKSRRFVVPSAPGKRNKKDTKVVCFGILPFVLPVFQSQKISLTNKIALKQVIL